MTSHQKKRNVIDSDEDDDDVAPKKKRRVSKNSDDEDDDDDDDLDDEDVSIYYLTKSAPVAQLDLHPTGDQEVAGSTPTRLATFFCGDCS